MDASRPDPGPAGPAPELIEGGFAFETAQAPILHDGLNLADLAHVLDLRSRGLIPDDAGRELLSVLLEIDRIPAADFPYDPRFGEVYNSRERVLAEKLGPTAGWLHAGRPRREATRVAFRLYLRRELAGLVADVGGLAAALADQADRHAGTLFPDQTYLQQAQPSTVGHYLTAFAYPVVRDGERLVDALDWVNRSPGGAGCVNGSRLVDDRYLVAALLGFDEVITHTRDAMWQTDGLVQVLATMGSLATKQDELAEDLEIWASTEFDYVDLDDAYTRASVLMPQKRNPYALAMIRGSTGTLIGQLAGFMALQKGPSARSDKLIFAYGELPRAVDLGRRLTRLSRGVVATLRFNEPRMREQLDRGFSQATDLAEYIMTTCDLDYRTAYRLVGTAVRRASAGSRRGTDIGPKLLDEVAMELLGRPLALEPEPLAEAMAWDAIIATRNAVGGAAPAPVADMVAEVGERAIGLLAIADGRATFFAQAETALRDRVRAAVGSRSMSESPDRPVLSLPDEVVAVNVGLDLFAKAIEAQGRPVVNVDWRIPGRGDLEVVAALRRLYGVHADRVERANAEVVRRLDEGQPMAVDVAPAGTVIPGVGARTVLHCGPRVDYASACDPLRRSMRAAVVAEGWAGDADGAHRLLAGGEVTLEPANLHDAVVPMVTAIGPSQPVWVVDNAGGSNRAFAPVNQGPGATAWFGVDAPPAIERLRFLAEVAGPLLRQVVARHGPIDVLGVAGQGVQMGDDVHIRTQASTNLLLRNLLPHVAGLDDPARVELAAFLSTNHLFFLTLAMAAARALLGWAAEVPDSSIVTTMCRNGTEFTVGLAGGGRWFLAPAPEVGDGLYYAGFGPESGAPDVGDSAVLELVGLGGAAAGSSPTVAAFVGGTMADAAALTMAMDEVAAGRSSRFKLALLDFRGTPLGVDARRVVELGRTPRITTGILHVSEGTGQIGAGVAAAPIEGFREAVLDLDRRLGS